MPHDMGAPHLKWCYSGLHILAGVAPVLEPQRKSRLDRSVYAWASQQEAPDQVSGFDSAAIVTLLSAPSACTTRFM